MQFLRDSMEDSNTKTIHTCVELGFLTCMFAQPVMFGTRIGPNHINLATFLWTASQTRPKIVRQKIFLSLQIWTRIAVEPAVQKHQSLLKLVWLWGLLDFLLLLLFLGFSHSRGTADGNRKSGVLLTHQMAGLAPIRPRRFTGRVHLLSSVWNIRMDGTQLLKVVVLDTLRKFSRASCSI